MKKYQLTSSTVSVLKMFRNVYSHAYKNHPESYGARLYQACNDAFYNNNEPVNILKVCIILQACSGVVALGHMLPVTSEVVLRDMAKISGYKESELLERVA